MAFEGEHHSSAQLTPPPNVSRSGSVPDPQREAEQERPPHVTHPSNRAPSASQASGHPLLQCNNPSHTAGAGMYPQQHMLDGDHPAEVWCRTWGTGPTWQLQPAAVRPMPGRPVNAGARPHSPGPVPPHLHPPSRMRLLPVHTHAHTPPSSQSSHTGCTATAGDPPERIAGWGPRERLTRGQWHTHMCASGR